MHNIIGGLSAALLLAACNAACASDGFGSVHCDTSVPKALVGQSTSNEPVAAIEKRHQDLKLKDLGGSEVSDRLFLASWQICGDEYALLEEKNAIRDVIKVPAHSRDAPQFVGACQTGTAATPGTVIAILKNEPGAERLAATAAWKIDEKAAKFVELGVEGLRCPRDGVITADGGR